MQNKFVQLLASRKFWAAIIGLAFMFLKTADPDFTALDEEQVTTVVVEMIGIASIVVSYILGTAIEDSKS